MSIEPGMTQDIIEKDQQTLAKELTKALNRKEELNKQYTTLNKDHTTLLRKVSSLYRVLENLDDSLENSDDEYYRNSDGDDEVDTLIPESILQKLPELQLYNDLIAKIDKLDDKELTDEKYLIDEVGVPEEMLKIFEIHSNTALLYKDSANYIEE